MRHIYGDKAICIKNNLAAHEQLLHYVSDEVASGSYKYYSLMYDDQYCLQSTTCGEDIIFIPQSFKRPVSIGVYGHPSHEASQYNLFVYHVALGADEITDEQSTINSLETSVPKKITKKSFVLAFLWTLLDEFIQVLF
ncbi:UPF0669 protein C6orf120 homolog [Cotesia glomerata]|uniref:UPF0669 protein C6orf120 homolog n=1 Tax=Cotesia glomerata TaxID=32391 RepID=UPI001D0062C2|nr:UPF0669 protein C6orf120 homolog [Cotesia glomerata]